MNWTCEIPGNPVAQARPRASEEWLVIEEYPDYEVSNIGRVRRITGGQGAKANFMLKVGISQRGYREVNLRKNGKSCTIRVHRLVILAFNGPQPPGMECCHINGDRSDARLDNLRWGTRSDNVHDAIRHGTYFNAIPKGSKLSEATRRKMSISKIGNTNAKRTGVTTK